MCGMLSKAKNAGSVAYNIVKSAEFFLVAQSDHLSETYAKHKGRIELIRAVSEIFIDEGKTLNAVKKELLSKYINAEPLERIRIRRDIDFVDSSMRQLGIYNKSLLYLPTHEDVTKQNSETKEISEHWLDKFNELARARNEEWRAELLARGLAAETTNPGTLSPRALWLIGTLEERLFKALGYLINLCSDIGDALVIPKTLSALLHQDFADCPLGPMVGIGTLLYMLDEIGLVADTSKAVIQLKQGKAFSASYLSARYKVTCKKRDFELNDIMFSPTGDSIARLCKRMDNALGRKFFNEWITTLPTVDFAVVNLSEGPTDKQDNNTLNNREN